MAKSTAGRKAATRSARTPAKTRRTAIPGTPSPARAAPLARPTTRTRFTLFDLLGRPRGYYLVEPAEVPRPAAGRKATAGHGVIVVDRSASMAAALAETKETLLKILTLDEYARSDMVVTLISFAGAGDVAVHFERAPVREIMKKDSKYQKELRDIRTAPGTCISGALRAAADRVRAGEPTSITLHTDGYADDPSPAAEADRLLAVCDELRGKDAFVNAVAYTDRADFRLLSRVANAGGGACVPAGRIAEVYRAVSGTDRSPGAVLPPVEVPLAEGFDYQVFVSRSAGRVLGAAGPLAVKGLRPTDDAAAFQFRRLSKAEYDKLKGVPVEQTGEAVFAFARANLAAGNLNTAKYALASTFDATLIGAHARALTNAEVADFAEDLDTLLLFNTGQLAEHTILTGVPVSKKIPLLDLVRLLDANRANFLVNRPALQDVYVRRGIDRIPGTRDEAGNLTEPTHKAEFVSEDEYLPVAAFDVSRTTATLNMLLARRVRLVPAAGGEPITEVAGIPLDDLSAFNAYTLVGDGELNVPFLKVKITDRSLFDKLANEGVLHAGGGPATRFDEDAEYTLRLDDLPVVPPFAGAPDLDGVFDELARLRVLSGLCAAHLRDDAGELTPEQVEALRRHDLSRNLNLNFPTTTPYRDLEEALAEGSVGVRTGYRIEVGDRHILNLGKFPSANEFLARMYVVTRPDGSEIEKPTFADLLDGDATVRHKSLSPRTKVTKADEFARALFDDFLGLRPNGSAVAVLESVKADKLAVIVRDRAKGKQPGRKAFAAALADAQEKLDARSDAVYAKRLAPLVFYVGATGLLPDEIDAPAESAAALARKYPDLTFSKDEKAGTFFELGDTLLGVYAKPEYFSREPGKG